MRIPAGNRFFILKEGGIYMETKSVSGPIAGTRLTEEYIRMLGRLAYFMTWPMVNMHNRHTIFQKVPEPGLAGGIVPVAPLNQLSMLTDYIDPMERIVACPNQDVVYGFGIISLDREPVIVQVPDFGDRFWVYQACDQRTDGFTGLGKMYGTEPGFYMLVGPEWKGDLPKGVKDVFRSPTNIGVIIPRVFMNDTPDDRKKIQPLISQIMAYPLSQFTGEMKTKDWSKTHEFPSIGGGEEEVQWVVSKAFPEVLPQVLDEVPPLPGEETLYEQIRAVLRAATENMALKNVLQQAAIEADKELIKPLFQFRNYGIPCPYNWTTITNGAVFGTDYFTRTAVAKSNIFVNQPLETKYFYQDLDAAGERLNGGHYYTVTFSRGMLPPVKGFWSLTLYNEYHFFAPNTLNRYSLGTKNRNLQYDTDGSLTLYVQAEPPEEEKLPNWLPAPESDFTLYLRTYWPKIDILENRWTPPPVKRIK